VKNPYMEDFLHRNLCLRPNFRVAARMEIEMEGFLIGLGTMSMQAAVIILVICAVRALLIKGQVPQKYIMLLWMIPFFFMVFPWKISSPVGFWRAESVISQYQEKVHPQSDFPAAIPDKREPVGHYEGSGIAQTKQESIVFIEDISEERWYSAQNLVGLSLFAIWVIGVTAVLCYMLISSLKLRKYLICSICERDNIYLAEDIELPMVFGVIRPHIYLPTSMDAEHRSYVLAHEQTHIMRRDPIKKLIAFLIVGVHWFNPLAWVAFILLERDMEMACDEETVKRLGDESKKAYAGTLLWISAGRSQRSYKLGVPLAFGEVDTKQRIKNILTNKKTMQVVAIVVILVCIALTAVFMTKREESADTKAEEIAYSEPQQIEIVEAVVTEDMICGVDGIELVYVDDMRLICRDYNGLYVFDLKELRMLHQVALEPIGCQYTQGDYYCQMRATADGLKVYMHPQMSDELYIYDVEENTLWKQIYDFENASLWDSPEILKDVTFFEGLLRRIDYVEHDCTSYQSVYCAKVGENAYGYLTTGSGTLMDSSWVVREPGKLESCIYLFRENTPRPRLEGEVESSSKEFTMETLIAICNGGNIEDVFQGLVEEDSLCYSNFSKEQMGNSLTWAYFCEMSYEEKQYRMQVSYWKPETAAEYGKVANGLDDIYLCELASDDGLMLYRAESGYRAGKADIMEFLERRYDIGEYMTLELPEGVTLGNYQIYNNDIFSGCLMYGDYPETVHGEWCPEAWYALGGVGIVESPYEPMLIFEDGRLSKVWWRMNHAEIESEGEYIEGCDMQAMLCEAIFDSFTIPEWEEYKEKYPDALEEQCFSRYWYVFFGEPDSEIVYTVYLNQENFTKEDAIALAKSVRFVKR